MQFDRGIYNAALRSQTFGRPLHVYDAVASTNQTLWEHLDQGAPEGTGVLALHQTAGRGQWGRTWDSAPGGLYLSLALMPRLSVAAAGQLTLVGVWTIVQGLEQQGLSVDIKWPNDLTWQGRKLGGILTETRSHQGMIHQAVVGIGLNWSNPVPPTGVTLQTVCQSLGRFPVTSLAGLTALVVNSLERGYGLWQSQGMRPVLQVYWSRLMQRHTVLVANGELGRVVGITPRGELRVSWPASRRLVSYAPGSLPPNAVRESPQGPT